MEELRTTMDESVRRAAAAIAQADVLLLLTGAGWSADSGLAVYKDVADVQAYKDRDLTYANICEPKWLEEDPELFYGFWGRCFNDYRDTKEHEGYHIVKKWRDAFFAHTPAARALAARHSDEAQAFFSFTSNVDAHHLRVFGEEEVRECHGNSEVWQCSDRKCHAFSPEAEAESRWAAPSGFRFRVDDETQNAEAGPPAQPATAGGAAPSGAPSGLPNGGFASNQPKCPSCKKGLRPSILMFSDSDWWDDEAQSERWRRWLDAVKAQAREQEHTDSPLRVAIVEVGAGGNVTTVRRLAEDTAEKVQERGGVATLVRVNPDLPLADDSSNQAATISLPSYGLAAIKLIDAAITELQRSGADGIAAAEATPLTLETVHVEPEPEPEPEQEAVFPDGKPLSPTVKPGEVPPSTPTELENIRATFDRIDTDSSGTLDHAEVAAAARELGRVFIGTDLEDAMAEMDADGNGEVSFEEFVAWWEKGGKLSVLERFDLKWKQMGAAFDRVLKGALAASGIK